MADPDRFIGAMVDVDYASTRRFFDNRALRSGGRADEQVTVFGDQQPGLAAQRDRTERERIMPLMELTPRMRVLDLGCGAGRWAWHLAPIVESYLGIDFSSGLLDLARDEAARRGLDGSCTFQAMALADLDPAALAMPPPFDRVVVVGALMYLNDRDSHRVLERLEGLVIAGGLVYISEPIGVADRLTLIDHYSSELDDRYSAIYRSRAEYESTFDAVFPDWRVIDAGPLYPPELRNRIETMQYMWIMAKPTTGRRSP